MNVAIVGTGLIGGSMALTLREKKLAEKVIGVEENAGHAAKAIELGLVDEVLGLDDAISQSDLIILAIPVNAVQQLLPYILDRVTHQTVMDVGSIKGSIIGAVTGH